jgi:hypothetical protein
MEIVICKDGSPLFRCANCGAQEGLWTEDYKRFECKECGWWLELGPEDKDENDKD